MQTHSKRARQRRCRWTALPSSQPPAVDMPFPRHASQFCTMSASTLHSTWLHEQLHILQHMKLHGKCKSQNTRMTEAGNWNEVTRCDAKAVSLEKTSRPRLAASPHACCSRTGQPFSVQLAGSLRPPHRSQRPSCRRCCLATKASTCGGGAHMGSSPVRQSGGLQACYGSAAGRWPCKQAAGFVKTC